MLAHKEEDTKKKEPKFLHANVPAAKQFDRESDFLNRSLMFPNSVKTVRTSDSYPNHTTAVLLNDEIVVRLPGIRMYANVPDNDTFDVDRIASSTSNSSNESPGNELTVHLTHVKLMSASNPMSSSNSTYVV